MSRVSIYVSFLIVAMVTASLIFKNNIYIYIYIYISVKYFVLTLIA